MRTTEWDDWRDAWGSLTDAAPDPRIEAQKVAVILRRQRAIVRGERLSSAALVLIVAGALNHAASPLELTLGVGAMCIVAASLAFQEWRRTRERSAIISAPTEFVATMRSIRRSQLRFARSLGTSLAAEMLFFAVWWYGGLGLHHSLMSTVVLATLWLPVLVFAALAPWAWTLHRTARDDLRRLDRPKAE